MNLQPAKRCMTIYNNTLDNKKTHNDNYGKNSLFI